MSFQLSFARVEKKATRSRSPATSWPSYQPMAANHRRDEAFQSRDVRERLTVDDEHVGVEPRVQATLRSASPQRRAAIPLPCGVPEVGLSP